MKTQDLLCVQLLPARDADFLLLLSEFFSVFFHLFIYFFYLLISPWGGDITALP